MNTTDRHCVQTLTGFLLCTHIYGELYNVSYRVLLEAPYYTDVLYHLCIHISYWRYVVSKTIGQNIRIHLCLMCIYGNTHIVVFKRMKSLITMLQVRVSSLFALHRLVFLFLLYCIVQKVLYVSNERQHTPYTDHHSYSRNETLILHSHRLRDACS